MVVDGKKVEVKAAIETSYPGSDGYPIRGFVFSNMHKNPSTDMYVLKCLSPDRKRTLKEYHVPASEAKQRTLTITRSSQKYAPFLKKAQQIPVGYTKMQPDEKYRLQREEEERTKRIRETTGAMVGAMTMAGSERRHEVVKYVLNQSQTFDTSFSKIMRASVGAALGRQIARHTYRK